MTFESALKVLRQEPGLLREIRLEDGRTFRVRSAEQWMAAPSYLTVLDEGGNAVFFLYRRIATIRILARNGRPRKK